MVLAKNIMGISAAPIVWHMVDFSWLYCLKGAAVYVTLAPMVDDNLGKHDGNLNGLID